MTSISAKIREVFRNLRSDAVPRAPRPPSQETMDDVTREIPTDESEPTTTTDNHEEKFIGPEYVKDDKPKKTNIFSAKKEKCPGSNPKNKESGPKVFNVNTQANGSVITVLESPGFRLGNDFVYYMGPTQHNGHTNTTDKTDPDEELIEKTNDIILLLEAKIMPEHDYIDYIAKNLGKNWHYFFRKLGYTKGRIETFEMDEARNGVSEARYKLLLDWMRNDKDGSLGKLATILWTEGERQIVKELSLIYIAKKDYQE